MNARAPEALRGLDPGRTLREQLAGIFSVPDSPIWMDSSTTAQCRTLEEALGGPQAVAELTGSRAYERFTGNQIAKIYQAQPEAYAATDRIALVSSFGASLLVGKYAPIDAGDGAGMNLMDLRRKTWARMALNHTARGLERKLGRITASHKTVGDIHPYYVRRYGFSPDCRIVAFSGDNPCSLAGLRLRKPGDIAISLGTSDTVFGSLSNPTPSATEGHIFANPIDPDGYMALICYKNGSLTREFVRNEAAGGSWEVFRERMAGSPVGNLGRIGFYVREPEITPPIMKTGIFRFDGEGRRVDTFDPAVEARAVVEGQFLSMRLHGGSVGLQPTSILATGGASVDAAVLRVMADVFGVPVFVGEQPNSAALGAAYRAMHGWLCKTRKRWVTFDDLVSAAPPFRKSMEPDPAAHAVYTAMLARYSALEREVAGW
jgi:xylulokinase